MPDIQIKISNMPEIRAAFKQAPALMAEQLQKAIEKSMFVIQGETILNVSGTRGINVVTGGLLRATNRPPEFAFLSSVYTIDIPYGIYVHDGTYKMPARPFLKDAVDKEELPVIEFFKKAVQNVLDRIGKDIL